MKSLSESHMSAEETIKGEFSVTLLRENEDGSADYQFNCSQEVLNAFARFGIITALKAAIDDAKLLNPDEPVGENT